jgi:hypothetical protein
LYRNPTTQKFQYFRHDLDLSFGMFEGNPYVGNFSNRDIYNWCKDGIRMCFQFDILGKGELLPSRILSIAAFRELYKQYFKQLLTTYFYPNSMLNSAALALGKMADMAAQRDCWHHLDYAWSYQEFASNYEDPVERTMVQPPVIIDSISSFIKERWYSAWKQLNQ